MEKDLEIKALAQIVHFVWKLLKERLPTKALLNSRLPYLLKECDVCGQTESIHHLFLDCPRVVDIWWNSPLQLRSTRLQGDSMMDIQI